MRNRGALIVLEGCDRAGKTTQCKKLGNAFFEVMFSVISQFYFFFVVERLKAAGKQAQYLNFPDRSTPCGVLINSYLTNKQDFNDEGIHLLFTLNRWEAKKNMEKLLNEGTTLIVDRYSYSGVAFSAAKGLDLKWCKEPETGLLKPDLVILLTLTSEAMARRGGFGEERYEIPEFQLKANKVFMQLKDDDYWNVIDADKTEVALNDELNNIVEKTIKCAGLSKLDTLW